MVFLNNVINKYESLLGINGWNLIKKVLLIVMKFSIAYVFILD